MEVKKEKTGLGKRARKNLKEKEPWKREWTVFSSSFSRERKMAAFNKVEKKAGKVKPKRIPLKNKRHNQKAGKKKCRTRS